MLTWKKPFVEEQVADDTTKSLQRLQRKLVSLTTKHAEYRDLNQSFTQINNLINIVFFIICSIFISVSMVIARTLPLLSLNNIISIIVLIPHVTLLSLGISTYFHLRHRYSHPRGLLFFFSYV